MNNRHTFHIGIAITTQIAFVTLGFASPIALASEQDDIYQLCSKFPLNSKCEGYQAPISLKKRDGDKAKCLVNGEEKAKACKVVLKKNTLSAYIETGDRLKVLGNAKDTTKMSIPLSTIRSFNYSEKSKINVGAVLALGVWGLLAKNKTATFGIQYLPETADTNESSLAPPSNSAPQVTVDNDIKVEHKTEEIEVNSKIKPKIAEKEKKTPELAEVRTNENAQSSQQFLFVIQRKKGRNMREKIEQTTGLSAKMFSIDE